MSDPCAPVTVTAEDGAELTACRHGGHVLGWVPAGGRQRLWLSPAAECGAGKAIRGGVPVIFPQFAARGPLPKHGIARDRAWAALPAEDVTPAPGAPVPAVWRARLTDDDATREIWPHAFELTITASAAAARLEVTLDVRNTGDEPWSFSAALHTYLALGTDGAWLTGLGGRIAEDNANPGQLRPLGEVGDALLATEPRDVAVLAASGPVQVVDGTLGALVLRSEGFGDKVVWNPGPGHGLSDVPDGAERGFVCVEPARLSPFELASGSTWTGRMSLEVI